MILPTEHVRDLHLEIVDDVDEMEDGLAIGTDDDEVGLEFFTIRQGAGDIADDEVDAAVTALTSILEPIMIVVMGVVIGGMVVAMYLPMFDLMKTVQG